jgi:hypothetical protein
MGAVIHEPGFGFFIEQKVGLLDSIELVHGHRLARDIRCLQGDQPDFGAFLANVVEDQGVSFRIQFDMSRRIPNENGERHVCITQQRGQTFQGFILLVVAKNDDDDLLH